MFEKPNYTYKFTVTKFIDGDTIRGDVHLGMGISVSKTLRFLDIDTEELRSKDVSRKDSAKKAKARVTELCENASVLYIKSKKDKTGKYGRLLGWLLVEDVDGKIHNVNQILINEGYEKR